MPLYLCPCTWQDAFGDALLSVTCLEVVVSVVEQEAVELGGQQGSSGWMLQLVVELLLVPDLARGVEMV